MATTPPRARVPIILGAATFALPEAQSPGIDTTTTEQGNALLDVLVKYGHSGVDTSNAYGEGTSEDLIGRLNIEGRVKVDTKLSPTAASHAPEQIRKSVKLAHSKVGKINVLYLHLPDKGVPLEDIHREIDALYKEGYFSEFGLRNYPVHEVTEFVMQAKHHGWIAPTVFQEVYNAADRIIEHELLPALRKYGIRLYAYSPLAGGFLTGALLKEAPKEGSHWHSSFAYNSWFQNRYGHKFSFLRDIQPIVEKHGLSFTEVGHRWLQHHSALGPNDRIVVGSRKPEQLEDTLKICERGPLPEELVQAMQEAYEKVDGKFIPYWF